MTRTHILHTWFSSNRVCLEETMFRQSKLLFEYVFGRSVHSKETENIFHYNKCDNNGGMLTHTVLWVMISRRKICRLDILWKTYDLLLMKIYFRHLSTVIWFRFIIIKLENCKKLQSLKLINLRGRNRCVFL